MAPVVCLGQRSTEIGAQIGQLGPRLDTNHVCVSSVSHEGALRFEVPSFFTMPSAESAAMSTLVDRVFKELEGSDVRTSLAIVVDSCSGLGSSLSSALLQELSDLVPELPLHVAISYTTDGDCLQGLGAYNHLMTMQASLLHADAVMCRGIHDVMSLGCESLEDATAMVATDVMMALHPSLEWKDYRGMQRGGIFSSLPHTMQPATTTKLLDVRSSLWRLRRGMKKVPSREHQKYHPLRALSANLHSLHVFSDHPENTRRKHDVASAHLHQMILFPDKYSLDTGKSSSTTHMAPRSKNSTSGSGYVHMVEKDILANLKWAMPTTRWSHLEAPCIADRSIAATDLDNGTEVNALCFASHHSWELQKTSVARVRALLSRKAFVHRFEEAGLEAYDLSCCVENVSVALGLD